MLGIPIALELDNIDCEDNDEDLDDDIVLPFVSPRVTSINYIHLSLVQFDETEVRVDVFSLLKWLRDSLIGRLNQSRRILWDIQIAAPVEGNADAAYGLLWLLFTHPLLHKSSFTIRLEVFEGDDPSHELGQLLSTLGHRDAKVNLALLYAEAGPLDAVNKWLTAGLPLKALRLRDAVDLSDCSASSGLSNWNVMQHLLPYSLVFRVPPSMSFQCDFLAPVLERLYFDDQCSRDRRHECLDLIQAPSLRLLGFSSRLVDIGPELQSFSVSSSFHKRCPRLRSIFIKVLLNDLHDNFGSPDVITTIAEFQAARRHWLQREGTISLSLENLGVLQTSKLVTSPAGTEFIQSLGAFTVSLDSCSNADVARGIAILTANERDWQLVEIRLLRVLGEPPETCSWLRIAEWLHELLARCGSQTLHTVDLHSGISMLPFLAPILPTMLRRRQSCLPLLSILNLTPRSINFDLSSLIPEDRLSLRHSAHLLANLRIRYQFGVSGVMHGRLFYDPDLDKLVDDDNSELYEPTERRLDVKTMWPIIYEGGLPERAAARL